MTSLGFFRRKKNQDSGDTKISARTFSVHVRRYTAFILGSGCVYVVLMILSSLSACGPTPSQSVVAVSGGREVAPRSRGVALRSTLALTTPELKAKGHSFCTATLVAPRIAITAAHCVMADKGLITSEDLLVGYGADVASARVLPVDGIVVHSGYRDDGLTVDPELPMHDLAVLRLKVGTLGGAKPTALASESTKLVRGEKLRIAGYGVSHSRQTNDTGHLRQVHMRIDEIERSANLLHLLGPRRSGYAREPGYFGGERLVRIHAGACAGDSGGPAYLEDKQGSARLVGVTSFGTELPVYDGEREIDICVGRNGYTDVRPYLSALRSVMITLRGDQLPPGRRAWFDERGGLQWNQ